jgi:hypothetical protein
MEKVDSFRVCCYSWLRSDKEAVASGKKRAKEASTPSKAERSKKAKIPQYIYIVLYTEGGPYREVISEIIGLYPKHVRYSTQKLPLKPGVAANIESSQRVHRSKWI